MHGTPPSLSTAEFISFDSGLLLLVIIYDLPFLGGGLQTHI